MMLGGTFFRKLRLIVMAEKNIFPENLEWVFVGRKIVALVDFNAAATSQGELQLVRLVHRTPRKTL